MADAPTPLVPLAVPHHGVPLDGPLHPGDLGSLGGYRVLRQIGQGGMGVVFLAVDPTLRRKVALKVMRPKHAARPVARERFQREAQATAAIRSDHVVTIFQVGEANGIPFLAMEHLHGLTLEDYLRDKPAPTLPQLVRLARELAAGLAAAHALGVVHRDLKPANVWLEAPQGRAKLIDFGLARQIVADADADTSRPGMVIGTPAYMSPEQARGSAIDARSDLYSLGVVLYRLTTGRLPFAGGSPMDQLAQLLQDVPRSAVELNPTLPPRLANLIDRLMAKNPADRPRSADEVLAELERVLDVPRQPDQPSTSTVVYVPIPVPASVDNTWASLDAATPLPGFSIDAVRAPRNNSNTVWLVGGIAAAALIVLAMFVLLAPRHPPEVVVEPARSRPMSLPEPKVRPPRYVPLDAAWEQGVRKMSPADQAKAVAEALVGRNRGLAVGDVSATFSEGAVTELKILSGQVTDLTPVRALPKLWSLQCSAPNVGGLLTDLASLSGLPLRRLDLGGQSVGDLGPLRGMPLETLVLTGTRVESLLPLKGAPLAHVNAAGSPLLDLAPLRGAPLRSVTVSYTQVTDLEPLRGMPLRELTCGPRVTDFAPLAGTPLEELTVFDWEKPGNSDLRKLRTLTRINGVPADQFWALHERREKATRQVPVRGFTTHDRPIAVLAAMPSAIVVATTRDVRVRYLNEKRSHKFAAEGAQPVGRCLALVPGTQTLVVPWSDKTLRSYDLSQPNPVGTEIPLPHACERAALSADGRRAAVVGPKEPNGTAALTVMNLATRAVVASFPAEAGNITALAFTPDGNGLLLAGGGTLRLRDLAAGTVAVLAQEPGVDWQALAVSDRPVRVAAVARTGEVRLWELGQPKPLGAWYAPQLTAVAFEQTGPRLFTAGADGWVTAFTPGQPGPSAEFRVRQGSALGLAFVEQGTLAVATDKHDVRLYDLSRLGAMPSAPAAVPPGFAALFPSDGLAGWRAEGAAHADTWKLHRGVLTGTADRGMSWLRTARDYGDYELRIDYRWLDVGGDSGIGVRGAGRAGVEVMLFDEANYDEVRAKRGDPRLATGGLLAATGTTGPNPVPRLRPNGDWNAIRVVVEGKRIRVEVNGTQVADESYPDGPLEPRGPLALQIQNGRIEFRNAFVREIR